MNKQEALAYTESGAEAVIARNEHSAYVGERVRVLGYGYRKPSRYDRDPTRGPGYTGVLVESLNPHTYWKTKVVPLRQVFATTVEEARVERQARDHAAAEQRMRAQAQHDEDKAYANRLIEVLGGGVVVDHYGAGSVFIKLTLDQARDIAERLSATVPA